MITGSSLCVVSDTRFGDCGGGGAQDGNNRIGTSKAADEPQDIVLPCGAVDDEHCIIEVIPKADSATGPSPPVSCMPRRID